MQEINIKSYAKLNLALDIHEKATDGYHRIESIMHEIDLHDNIMIKKIKEDKIRLFCNINELETPENIAFKSAMLLKGRFNIKEGAEIIIKKRIPLGGGLGGGSSNASAVLCGLNNLWKLRLPEFALCNIASEIGSDVPFFIRGGTAHAYNRGELIENIHFDKKLLFLIVYNGIVINTKHAYSLVNIGKTGKECSTRKIINAIDDNKNIPLLFHNDFEQFIFLEYPKLSEIKEDLINNGAVNASMTGSGSTIFGVFDDAERLELAFKNLKNEYRFVERAISKF